MKQVYSNKIMNNYVFAGLIWKYIGEFYHKTDVTSVLLTEMTPNFQDT